MKRPSWLASLPPLTTVTALSLSCLVAVACGGGSASKTAADVDEEGNPKPASTAEATTDDGGAAATASGGSPGSSDDSAGGAKKDECTVLDEPSLEGVLLKNACEVPNPPPGQAPDLSKQLVVKVTVSPNIVPAGSHADVLVTFTNKGSTNLPLFFTIDPMPRFDIEVYNTKGNRVDLPKNQPPPLPEGMPAREPGEQKTARIILAANGVARMAMGWDAVKTKWAPDKLKGTPPEKGYPRSPAGPLPKGKYSLKVVTPLVNVFEGIDHEVSQPRVDVMVGKAQRN